MSPVFARERDVRWGRGGRLDAEREGREVEERYRCWVFDGILVRLETLPRLDIDPPALHLTVLCLHVQDVGQEEVEEEVIVANTKSSKSFRL